MNLRKLAPLFLAACALATPALAGGPLLVGGPHLGVDGKPITWNPSKMPIQYRVDPGPMAVNATGATVISNSAGAQRVQSMFGEWTKLGTATISFANAGATLAAGSYTGGDVKTMQQYNDLIGSCESGKQNPVIFDADGSLLADLGADDLIIGFTHICSIETATGYIKGALVVMNGKMQDGVSAPSTTPPNYELKADEFDEAITHEIGHLLGLDHSQINLDLYNEGRYPCDADRFAGLPLMFPIEFCQSRKSAGLPLLSPDDAAWISKLYPSATQVTSYGTITGHILFADGVSAAQGVNVIARAVDDPSTPQDESKRIAFSAVSGLYFTGNPGQSLSVGAFNSQDNGDGSASGSRNPAFIGYYEISVPPGTYTVQVEGISSEFDGGSSVGPTAPVNLPGVPEYWDEQESGFDLPMRRDTITVHAGETVGDVDVILNTPDLNRFDGYEDEGALLNDAPLLFTIAGKKEA